MASRETKKTTKKAGPPSHFERVRDVRLKPNSRIQGGLQHLIDQNNDGFVAKEDLHDMLASLGKDPTDAYLEEMVKVSPGPINFTMFLTLFGEKLNGTDPEDVITGRPPSVCVV